MLPHIQYLADRASLLRQLRGWFDDRGFLEVQPPCLSRDCVVDTFIEPIGVETREFGLQSVFGDDNAPEWFYLQTSPELAMKRLLAAGAPSIYSIGPVFRGGELGPLHNLEFTMLEWYEVGAGYEAGIRLTGKLASDLLDLKSHEVLSYREAFREFAGCDPLEDRLQTIRDTVHQFSARLAGSLANDRDGLLDVLLSEKVAPRLGKDRPLVLYDYPLSQAALAKSSPNDERCAARFELFVQGIELANGYDELLDADELANRTRQHLAERQRLGRRKLPGSESLIAAMRRGLPECSGVALGFDRLLMLKVSETSVHRIMPFPTERA
ncbi:MAG: EF-P lysine aminoacylase EpmA [Planctomycetota bacterium]